MEKMPPSNWLAGKSVGAFFWINERCGQLGSGQVIFGCLRKQAGQGVEKQASEHCLSTVLFQFHSGLPSAAVCNTEV